MSLPSGKNPAFLMIWISIRFYIRESTALCERGFCGCKTYIFDLLSVSPEAAFCSTVPMKDILMRRVLIATLATLAIVLTTSTDSSSLQARQPRVTRSNDGFFARMMEMERRKNAWLRSTFGR